MVVRSTPDDACYWSWARSGADFLSRSLLQRRNGWRGLLHCRPKTILCRSGLHSHPAAPSIHHRVQTTRPRWKTALLDGATELGSAEEVSVGRTPISSRVCTGGEPMISSPSMHPRRIHRLTSNNRLKHLRLENLSRSDSSNIAVEHNEIRIIPIRQLAFLRFGKLRISRPLRIGIDRLPDRQLLLRIIRLRPRLVHARDSCIDAAKRRDRFNRIIGSEGQRHACVEK